MNESQLTDDIMQYESKGIVNLLANAGEDGVVSWNLKANGNWYFFCIDQDYNIMVDYAIPADNAHFEEFKQIVKDYGIDSSPKGFHRDMLKVGVPDGLYSNISDYFEQRRNPKFSALDGEPNREVKGLQQSSLRDINRNSQTSSEQSGEKVKEFRSKNGEVYGFVVDGETHLDTVKMRAETPLHEYTHLWTEALRYI